MHCLCTMISMINNHYFSNQDIISTLHNRVTQCCLIWVRPDDYINQNLYRFKRSTPKGFKSNGFGKTLFLKFWWILEEKDRRVNTPTITCDCSSNSSLKIFFMDVTISALFSDYSVCVTIEKWQLIYYVISGTKTSQTWVDHITNGISFTSPFGSFHHNNLD